MTADIAPAARVSATAPASLKDRLPAEAPQAWTKPLNSAAYKPTHADQFVVVFSESTDAGVEAFSSKAVATRDFAPGEQVALLGNITQAPVKAYSSVQYGAGPNDHLELNSDLLFMNHSCDPSVEMVLYPGQPKRWEVIAGPKGVRKGEDLTFFYPSTEWDMAQGFDCSCGAANCLGKVYGANYLTLEQLEERGLVNEHIRALKALQQAQQVNGANGTANGVNGANGH